MPRPRQHVCRGQPRQAAADDDHVVFVARVAEKIFGHGATVTSSSNRSSIFAADTHFSTSAMAEHSGPMFCSVIPATLMRPEPTT